jgi:predicted nucleotidyltransferase component of viral defense system
MIQPIIQDFINKYRAPSLRKKDILRDILQHSALLGLARRNFFEHAAFYGGTALRILYGLDRLSEDLDFSLLKPNPNFDFSPFLDGLEKEMASFGFQIEAELKKKEPPILSAFVKANTLKLLLTIEDSHHLVIHPDEKIAIKLEIDTTPPPGFEVRTELVLNPTPFYVLTYAPGDLFAGKMHAILCRQWKKRVKGRDWYDLIWFIKNKMALHLAHLAARMIQSKHLEADQSLDSHTLTHLLEQRIAQIDWDQAKSDVKPFLQDPEQLSIWSAKFFLDLIHKIEIQ